MLSSAVGADPINQVGVFLGTGILRELVAFEQVVLKVLIDEPVGGVDGDHGLQESLVELKST